ncbi:autotransporter outer membrane beta-barrel domain-containing protein [Bradyrhizobium sp. Cp5.3]|uniref:autotransporter family protein n=1 Tax=Bradyrhizobium sp. Cp5.3 TaxID=443598 RepID=UPI0009FE5050|nr:autotransporter outer membrane beta-barrel domain-containing protein [Bradyrhizobium sp. Cp5.3]
MRAVLVREHFAFAAGIPFHGRRQQAVPQPSGHASLKWQLLSWLALLVTVVLGSAVPAGAQTPFGFTNDPATWIGGTGTDQWNNQNNWQPQSGGHGVPLLIANFTNLAPVADRTVRDQNSQSIGTLNFTAPSYVLSLENGSVFTVNGTGFVINNPANRPIVDVGVVHGGTIKFTNASTGGVAKFVIASNGTLDMSGRTTPTGMTAGAIDNAGRIIVANSNANSVGNELTVFGTYIGLGGSIYLRTDLGLDSSQSDKLVIDSSRTVNVADGPAQAIGSTLLHIIPGPNSPGAYTTANGILVVEAVNGGTTAESAFTLAGEVRAGFYDYRLYRSGFNGTNPDDWFLRSTFNGGNGNGGNGDGGGNGGNGNGGGGPITPPDELPPDVLPEDLPPVLPPGVYPIIGPEIATYGVVQPTARQLGLATLGTLHERIGDTLAIGNAGGNGWTNSVWVRGFGEQINNRYRAFADPRTEGQLAGFQSGIDLWRGSLLPGHRDAGGIYFAYANSNVDVTGLVTNEAATNYVLRKTGSLNLNGWSGGAYWTHYGPSGWYVDAVLQATAYQGTASTMFASLPTNGFGFVSSLEAGYPIPVPALGPGFVLEPQGQIVWQRVSFDGANDGLGDVALGSTSGASGRLGLRGRWTIIGDGGLVLQPYVRANLWRDWGARATTTFSGVDVVPLLEQGTRLDLSAGVTAKIDAGLSLYAQAGYQFAVGNTDGHKRDGVRADLGLRYAW